MKKFQAVVLGAFDAYQQVRGVEITDFRVISVSHRPMHITVYLHYNDNPQVEKLDLVLKQGTIWELSAYVARWLSTIDFAGIREAFENWEELNKEL